MEAKKKYGPHNEKIVFNRQKLLDMAFSLLKQNEIEISHVVNLYHWGSYLFGTAEESSDYDFVCILKAWVGPLKNKEHLPFAESHFSNVLSGYHEDGKKQADIAIYHENFWQVLISKHVPWTLVLHHLHLMDSEFSCKVLIENRHFHFQMELMKLRNTALKDFSKNAKLAKKYWFANDIRKSKKRIIYILQHLEYSIQLARDGIISDLYAVNHYHYQIFSIEFKIWDEMDTYFRSIYDSILETYFYPIVNRGLRYVLKDPTNKNPLILEYLASLPFDSIQQLLLLYLSVTGEVLESKRENKRLDLCLLHNAEFTPWEASYAHYCSGIVVSKYLEEKDWKIIAFPFLKFFDILDDVLVRAYISEFNWKNFTIYEKLDGILTTLYWDSDFAMWKVSFGHSIQFLSLWEQTFLLFWQTWKELNFQFPQQTNFCYMFEFIHPKILNIVQHKKADIVFLGARNLETLQEVSIEFILNSQPNLNWNSIKSIPFQTRNMDPKKIIDEIIFMTLEKSPFVAAGFVLLDSNFQRLSVKSPGFLLIGRLKKLTNEDYDTLPFLLYLLRILLPLPSDHEAEFLSLCPYHETNYFSLKAKVIECFKQLDQYLVEIKSQCKDIKEVAALIKRKYNKWKGPLFIMEKSNISAQEMYSQSSALLHYGHTRQLETFLLGKPNHTATFLTRTQQPWSLNF